MRVDITRIYGMSYASTAQLSQGMIAELGMKLGFNEVAYYYFNVVEEDPKLTRTRMDGIFSGVQDGDVFILQSPTWMGPEYDQKMLFEMGLYDIRKVIFINDVFPLMFASNRYILPEYIDMYNQADVLIVPTEKMLKYLRGEGLTVENVVIQEYWDHPTAYQAPLPKFTRKISFTGNPERFGFVAEWNHDIPLYLYTRRDDHKIGPSVIYKGFRKDENLIRELSDGFGLCWSATQEAEYATMNCSFKLPTFIVAGLPIIIKRGISGFDFVEKNNLGIVVDTLEEACERVNAMDEEEYLEYGRNVCNMASYLRSGFHTQEILLKAVRLAAGIK